MTQSDGYILGFFFFVVEWNRCNLYEGYLMCFAIIENRNGICLEVNSKCVSFDFDPLLKGLVVCFFLLLYEMKMRQSCCRIG